LGLKPPPLVEQFLEGVQGLPSFLFRATVTGTWRKKGGCGLFSVASVRAAGD